MNCGCLLKGSPFDGNQTILEACVLHLAWTDDKLKAAELQIEELKKQAENMVDNSLTACRAAYKKGLEDQKKESDRLNEVRHQELIRVTNMLNTAVPHGPADPDDPCPADCRRCALEKKSPEKRNDEVLVYPMEKCENCGREHNLAGIACPCRFA